MELPDLLEIVLSDVILLSVYLEEASRIKSSIILSDWETELEKLTKLNNITMSVWGDDESL